jgi:hypothetical protein
MELGLNYVGLDSGSNLTTLVLTGKMKLKQDLPKLWKLGSKMSKKGEEKRKKEVMCVFIHDSRVNTQFNSCYEFNTQF